MSGKSLAGRTILITRSPSQSGEFRDLLEKKGAKVLELATIQIKARPETEIDPTARRVTDWDWLIFTSANAVRIFLERCERTGSLERLKKAGRPAICAVGPATRKSIEEYQLKVNLIPDNFQAEGILEALSRQVEDLATVQILLPVASQARPVLPAGLRQRGADLTVLPVYDTVAPENAAPELRALLKNAQLDLVAVTSSSTARNFVSLCFPSIDPKQFSFASIGPVTGKTCRELGLRVAVESSISTVPGLVDAICSHFA